MSKNRWAFILMALLVASPVLAFADLENEVGAPKTDEKKIAEPPAVQVKISPERLKKLQERKDQLDNTEWDIKLGSSDKRIKPVTDKLIFKNKMISLESFAKEGFGPTNYTVTVSEDLESATFETMQSGKAGVLFIRGDWTKDTMQGNINERIDNGKKTLEYFFTSSPMKKITPSDEPEKSAEAKEAPKSALPAALVDMGKDSAPAAAPVKTTKPSGKYKKAIY